MPIDPRIPLGVGGGGGGQVHDPMQTLAQVAALQNMQLQRQEAQQRIGIQEQNLQINQQEELRKKQALEQAQAATGRVAPLMGLQSVTVDQVNEALAGATPEVQLAARTILQKHQDLLTEGAKKEADLKKTKGEVDNLTLKRRANLARGIRQFGYDPQVAALAFGLEAEHDPEVGKYWEVAQQSPDKLKQVIDFYIQRDPENKDYAKMVVGAGASLVDPNVPNPTALFTGPAKEPDPAKLGSLEDYILTKFGQNATPAQQLQARREWEQAGQEPNEPSKLGSEDDFIRRMYGPKPTPEQIQEGLRLHGESQRGVINFDPKNLAMAGTDPTTANAYSTALSRATSGGNITQQKRNAWNMQANELAKRGDFKQLGEIIGQAAVESENVDQRNLIRGRVGMRVSLGEIQKDIEAMRAAGADTSLLSGTMEQIAQKAGVTGNPQLARLAARMKTNLINYRRATTGVQFGEKEAQAYEDNYPGSMKEGQLNISIIQGLLDQVSSDDAVYWHNKVGPQGMQLIKGAIRPETIGWEAESTTGGGAGATPPVDSTNPYRKK